VTGLAVADGLGSVLRVRGCLAVLDRERAFGRGGAALGIGALHRGRSAAESGARRLRLLGTCPWEGLRMRMGWVRSSVLAVAWWCLSVAPLGSCCLINIPFTFTCSHEGVGVAFVLACCIYS
jgi:hypothetical protein